MRTIIISLAVLILAATLVTSGCAVSRTTGAGQREFALMSYKTTQPKQTTVGMGCEVAKMVPNSNDVFTGQHANRSLNKTERQGPSLLDQ